MPAKTQMADTSAKPRTSTSNAQSTKHKAKPSSQHKPGARGAKPRPHLPFQFSKSRGHSINRLGPAPALLRTPRTRARARPGPRTPTRALLRRPRSNIIIHPHGQRNPLTLDVDLQHFHLDDLPGLHDFMRVLDEFRRHRRHMHKPILMHADIDKRTKRSHVGHDTFEHHPRRQVGNLLDAFAESRRLELGTRIAPWLFKFRKNIPH